MAIRIQNSTTIIDTPETSTKEFAQAKARFEQAIYLESYENVTTALNELRCLEKLNPTHNFIVEACQQLADKCKDILDDINSNLLHVQKIIDALIAIANKLDKECREDVRACLKGAAEKAASFEIKANLNNALQFF